MSMANGMVNICEALLDEYRALRRRTEGMRTLSDPTAEDLEALGIRQEDIARLNEVRRKLEAECDLYLSAEDKVTVRRDAGNPPSQY